MGGEPIGMVLAAGLGTRLHPLTLVRPKPAIPFLGRPLVRHALDLLAGAGVSQVLVNLHHLGEQVREAVRGFSGEVEFSEEVEILGTAGALGKVRDRLAGRTIFLVNGKIYFEQDLGEVLAWHRSLRAMATLVLVPSWPGCPFSPVLRSPDGLIKAFRPLPAPGGERSDTSPAGNGRADSFVFTGVHILEPEVLDYIPAGFSDSVRDVYPRLMADGKRVMGFVSSAFWCESSTPQRYLENTFSVMTRRPDLVGRQGTCEKQAPEGRQSIFGDRVKVDSRARLDRCILWDDVAIDGDVIAECVIFTDGVRIAESRRFSNCVVTPVLPAFEGGTGGLEGRLEDGLLVWPFRAATANRVP